MDLSRYMKDIGRLLIAVTIHVLAAIAIREVSLRLVDNYGMFPSGMPSAFWLEYVSGNVWAAFGISVGIYTVWNIVCAVLISMQPAFAHRYAKAGFWLALLIFIVVLGLILLMFFNRHDILVWAMRFSNYWVYWLPFSLIIPFAICMAFCSPRDMRPFSLENR